MVDSFSKVDRRQTRLSVAQLIATFAFQFRFFLRFFLFTLAKTYM